MSRALLLADRHLDPVLGVADDHLEVLVVRPEGALRVVVSVDADIQDLGLCVRRDLDLEAQEAGLRPVCVLADADGSHLALCLGCRRVLAVRRLQPGLRVG